MSKMMLSKGLVLLLVFLPQEYCSGSLIPGQKLTDEVTHVQTGASKLVLDLNKVPLIEDLEEPIIAPPHEIENQVIRSNGKRPFNPDKHSSQTVSPETKKIKYMTTPVLDVEEGAELSLQSGGIKPRLFRQHHAEGQQKLNTGLQSSLDWLRETRTPSVEANRADHHPRIQCTGFFSNGKTLRGYHRPNIPGPSSRGFLDLSVQKSAESNSMATKSQDNFSQSIIVSNSQPAQDTEMAYSIEDLDCESTDPLCKRFKMCKNSWPLFDFHAEASYTSSLSITHTSAEIMRANIPPREERRGKSSNLVKFRKKKGSESEDPASSPTKNFIRKCMELHKNPIQGKTGDRTRNLSFDLEKHSQENHPQALTSIQKYYLLSYSNAHKSEKYFYILMREYNKWTVGNDPENFSHPLVKYITSPISFMMPPSRIKLCEAMLWGGYSFFQQALNMKQILNQLHHTLRGFTQIVGKTTMKHKKLPGFVPYSMHNMVSVTEITWASSRVFWNYLDQLWKTQQLEASDFWSEVLDGYSGVRTGELNWTNYHHIYNRLLGQYNKAEGLVALIDSCVLGKNAGKNLWTAFEKLRLAQQKQQIAMDMLYEALNLILNIIDATHITVDRARSKGLSPRK
ncbi:hypothetical protein CROQUDRAFT_700846 [Cronartium quercuum f. sp. fusiforme G11]|uniref:Uncharacterized protein n=1 Tax=Cronartium quercuum f. sp. fusiforme G11 TaxID=708437 RepID=A0A9P6NH31_9BASI|nr:hypothetical protein CROQUDRAFT_700846 [Cronartium quercuum f. sp. fusiforme G11]